MSNDIIVYVYYYVIKKENWILVFIFILIIWIEYVGDRISFDFSGVVYILFFIVCGGGICVSFFVRVRFVVVGVSGRKICYGVCCLLCLVCLLFVNCVK